MRQLTGKRRDMQVCLCGRLHDFQDYIGFVKPFDQCDGHKDPKSPGLSL